MSFSSSCNHELHFLSGQVELDDSHRPCVFRENNLPDHVSTLHMRCCRPDLVIDIFLSVGLSCKSLQSATVLETATKKKHETIVEGERFRYMFACA